MNVRKSKNMLVAIILLLALVYLWQEGAGLSYKTKRVRAGMWGGEHISLLVENNGARLKYDCAHGTINQSMKIDNKGHFSVTGSHTRERGGPATEDEKPDTHPARYTGQVTGQKMVITVTLTDTKQTLGPFTLTYGESSNLIRCL